MNTEDAIAKYYALLSKWNEKISLISTARDVEEFRERHVDDAMELVPLLADARTVLDLGTGAGIPGIIIKIARPVIEVTLLDSIRKKVSFCEESIRRLGLDGIRAVCGRAEDLDVQAMLGYFDIVVSRATWRLEEYIRISTGYMDKPGCCRLLAMKGPAWREELDEAKGVMEGLGLQLIEAHEYRLKRGESRCILSIGRI